MKRTRSIEAPPAGCAQDLPKPSSNKEVSGSSQKALHCLTPLASRGVLECEFEPAARHVDWWPDEKGEALPRTCVPDLFIELERLSRELPTHIQEHQVVAMRLPENARPLQAVCGIYLDTVTAQNVLSHLARRLSFVNQQNLFAVEG